MPHSIDPGGADAMEAVWDSGESTRRRRLEWPTLGLAKHSTGAHGRTSKVTPSTSWRHDLLPGSFPTLNDLLAAMEAGNGE